MSDPISLALPASVRTQQSGSAGIFVGLREYDDPEISPLTFAVDDCVDLAHLFVVELDLLDPSKTALLLAGEPVKAASKDRLARLLERGCLLERPWQHAIYQMMDQFGGGTTEDGLLVAFLSTRGFDVRSKGVLAVAGTLQRRVAETGMPLEALLEELERSRAKKRLVLLDLWHERLPGAPLESREIFGAGFQQSLAASRGSAVFTAAGHNGFSYDDESCGNGLFAGALLDGLRGGALGEGSSDVAAEMLASFVHQQVRNWVLKKRPQDAQLNQGILARFETDALRQLPLSRPGHQQVDVFDEQVSRLLAHLLRQVGLRNQLFPKALEAFEHPPAHQHVALLEEIRSFDGSLRSHRAMSLRLEEFFAAQAPLAAQPPAPPAKVPTPASARPAPSPPKQTRRDTGSRSGSGSSPFADQGVDAFGTWADLKVGSAVQKMRWIEPGTFWMGAPKSKTYLGQICPLPRHEVELTQGFWLADTPCTQAFWMEVVGKNPSLHKGPNRPVDHLSWNRAQTFLATLNARIPKIQAHLPTEAQWEYACRAGTDTDTYAGDLQILGIRDAPVLDEIAWHSGNCGADNSNIGLGNIGLGNIGLGVGNLREIQLPNFSAGTSDVAQKAPNAWGLYDMLGNVNEWCRDADEFRILGNLGKQTDPCGESGSFRVLRGGSFVEEVRFLHAAFRWFVKPASALLFGFRFIVI